MSLLDNFPHRCTIQRRTFARGRLGGQKASLSVERTNVRCWQQQASDREIIDYEKRGIAVACKVYFTSDPGLTERHQIVVTEREGVAVTGLELDVKSHPVPDASAGLGVVWKVMCDYSTGSDD
jgi:hypothetical protein